MKDRRIKDRRLEDREMSEFERKFKGEFKWKWLQKIDYFMGKWFGDMYYVKPKAPSHPPCAKRKWPPPPPRLNLR